MENYIQQLKTFFKNVVLNAVGADRDLYTLLENRDVERAIELMQDRDDEVDKAIAEYNVQTHHIMNKPNKRRKNQPDFVTNKLPRNRQQYINEVELFFMLGKPIKWTKSNDGDDEAFNMFNRYIKGAHFNARMRQAKRLAGAETESAKLYRVYREGEDIRADIVVLARSTGYKLRPMFDQYGNMLAFACGYSLKRSNKDTEEHWDIYTKDIIFNCRRAKLGWSVTSYRNILGKIPVIYYKQLKAWDGAVARLEREEHLDSNTADTNDYFSNPIAKATADVIEGLANPEETGKLIQLMGPGSTFEYLNPPQNSATREGEKRDLNDSVLFDTFTPDLSFENMRGLGAVSGVAIKNAMTLAYMKRDNRLEVYEEMTEREKSIIIEILCLQNPGLADELRELKDNLKFEFQEPFATDDRDQKQMIIQLYGAGLMSLEEAVNRLGMCDNPEEEIARIRESKELEAMARQMEAQMAAGQGGENGGAEQSGESGGEESAAEPIEEDKNPATANKIV